MRVFSLNFVRKNFSITHRISIYPIFPFIGDLRYFFVIGKENLAHNFWAVYTTWISTGLAKDKSYDPAALPQMHARRRLAVTTPPPSLRPPSSRPVSPPPRPVASSSPPTPRGVQRDPAAGLGLLERPPRHAARTSSPARTRTHGTN